MIETYSGQLPAHSGPSVAGFSDRPSRNAWLFAGGEKVKEAEEAGADEVGGPEVVQKMVGVCLFVLLSIIVYTAFNTPFATFLMQSFLESIPKELEDAMSRQAQADREKNSRVILGSAEAEIAGDFKKAAEQYADDPCEKFHTKTKEKGSDYDLIRKMHKAITIIQFKLE